ncbi:SEC-C metal-binding domain-containing protein [Alkaliphilus serpentinus]|uniref:SEC-C metal-binding domain-containing protein n=1 Tax=Alkaliphilus serpentinus TaxID=1482731 RepID=UPI0018657B87|nr:SEC-C metal-binding domain-containing protein [Alkaliphilus serpentinus]
MFKVGRNEICPCGSGKKFKRCCGEEDKVLLFPSEGVLIEEFVEVKRLFFRYLQSIENTLNPQIQRAGFEYGIDPEQCVSWMGFFFEWFAFNHPIKEEMTIFNLFIKDNLPHFSDRVIKQLELWPQSYISIYTYIETLNNGNFLLEDCFTRDVLEVNPSAIKDDIDGLLVLRLLPMGKSYDIFHGYVTLPIEAIDKVITTFEDAKSHKVGRDKDWKKFLMNQGAFVVSLIIDLLKDVHDFHDYDDEDEYHHLPPYEQFLIKRFLQKPQKPLQGKSPLEACLTPGFDKKLDKFIQNVGNGKYDDGDRGLLLSDHIDYIIEVLEGSLHELKDLVETSLVDDSYKEEALFAIEKMIGEYYPFEINGALILFSGYCNRYQPIIKKRGSWASALEYLVSSNQATGSYYTQKEISQKYDVSATTLSKNLNLLVDGSMEVIENLYMEDMEDLEDPYPEILTPTPGNGRRVTEVYMNQVHKQLQNKNFQSIDELNEYMQTLMKNGIPEASSEDLSNEEKAQDLIYKAWEKSRSKDRIRLAKEALKIHSNCVDAYVLLAVEEATSFTDKEKMYLEALERGRMVLGENYFNENIGHFWLMTETRPYMRAKMGFALLLWKEGNLEQATKHFKEMLELNPNDNQGARYILLPIYMQLDKLKEARELINSYEDGSPQWTYNTALYNFKVKGGKKDAKAWLKDALEENHFIPYYLLGFNVIPKKLPEFFQMGSKEEAIVYANNALDAWENTKGALDWLLSVIN